MSGYKARLAAVRAADAAHEAHMQWMAKKLKCSRHSLQVKMEDLDPAHLKALSDEYMKGAQP